MLQLTNISKAYGALPVLDGVSFIVHRGERVGLVGPNGCGKTTVLRIITGLEQPDAGAVALDTGATIGYLPQGQELALGDTVGAVIRSGLTELEGVRERMEVYAERMGQGDTSEQMLSDYGEAVARFESLGGYEIEHRIDEVLAGLGLGDIPLAAPVNRLSGGQRTRLGLARLLLSFPALLLLDEPTNHLDIQALEWLEEFLGRYPGGVLLISHDRTFLDRTVSRILELDDRTHHLRVYVGSYSEYEAARARELEQQRAEWQDQQDEIARLKAAAAHVRGLARFRKGGKADSGDKFAKGFFANRGLETVRRAKSIERRVEHLLTDDKIDKPLASWQMKLDFGEMPRGGQLVVTLNNLGHAYDGRWLFRNVDQLLRHGERVALMGPNGTGKTTLLRIITGELAPTEGEIRLGTNVHPGYMPQEQEVLDPDQTPLDLMRSLAPLSETDARHLLHQFLFVGDEVFTASGRLSYGERARLLLARLVVIKCNCLVLDEPVNHLDIPSRERFEAALDAFPGAILVATHDRAFIDRFATSIWALEAGTIRVYPDRETMKGK
ncbi:MAG: ABC-F family ATP-binding cassette domain-containing protein [Anaerolineae bacterium]